MGLSGQPGWLRPQSHKRRVSVDRLLQLENMILNPACMQAKPTAACHTLRDPAEVMAFLGRLVEWGHSQANCWHSHGSCVGWALNPSPLTPIPTPTQEDPATSSSQVRLAAPSQESVFRRRTNPAPNPAEFWLLVNHGLTRPRQPFSH